MKVGNFFKKDSMSCSCLDADKANGKELHNQNLMGVWLFKIYFFTFLFLL